MPKLPQAMRHIAPLRPLALRQQSANSVLVHVAQPEANAAKTGVTGHLQPCSICGGLFTPRSIKGKYCSPKCRQIAVQKYAEESKIRRGPNKVREPKLCACCSVLFKPTTNTHKFCSAKCRDEYKKREPEVGKVLKSSRYPRGTYVYGWYRDDEDLPFYIGIGKSYRYRERHLLLDKTPQCCQRIREQCKNFRMVVFRDRLTNEGALLLEGTLIDLFEWMGAVFANQRRSLVRTEKLPLEVC